MNMSYNYNIFISYKWDEHKTKVHELAESLNKIWKDKIWLDKYCMKSGYIDEKVIKGVRESALFLCCVTDKYADFENSPNCELEFNNAVALKKKILFIIFENIETMKEDYVTKRFGVVGGHMARKLYFKYDTKNIPQILEATKELLAEIFNHKNASYSSFPNTSDVGPINLDTSILTENEIKKLYQFCKLDSSIQLKLLYRASKNGFGARDFHFQCDGHSNTIIIVKTDDNWVFGAYCSAKWSSENDRWQEFQGSYIFSLRKNIANYNLERDSFKADFNGINHVYYNSFVGPIFRKGFSICDESNWLPEKREGKNETDLQGFICPSHIDEKDFKITKSVEFTTEDIEVFHLG